MSHLSFDTTEAEVKEFFLPLEAESIKLLSRDGQPMGKANVYFKTHEDAVKAMEKDQHDLGTWRVNLYLNSTESGLSAPSTEQAKPAKATNKITFDEGDDTLNETADNTMNETADDTMNETADDTMNETAEADTTSSEKKKFKWDKNIKAALKAADNTLTIKKLLKAIIPKYTEATGEECQKSEIKEKLEQRLNKSSKFTYEDGTVSIAIPVA